MTLQSRGIVLLALQCAIVASVACKYAYDRATLPRVWVRAQMYDPETPVRGRYLALTPLVDACGMPHDPKLIHRTPSFSPTQKTTAYWRWQVRVKLVGDTLGVILVRSEEPVTFGRNQTDEDLRGLTQNENESCQRAALTEVVPVFVPEHWSQQPGQLWVEVSVPRKGDLRAIRLAQGEGAAWHVLDTH